MKRRLGAFGVLGGILIACGGSDGADGRDGANGPEGLHALVDTAPEAPGANCPEGGTRLRAGVDANRNGKLDDDEVDSTAYVCNGSKGDHGPKGDDGLTTLTSVTDEPPGANCAAGGKKVQTGTDDDRDGVLDPSEVDQISYLCHGKSGTNGIVNVTNEPAGTNCAAGGKKIETGIDDDGDGVLEASEIDQTSYVCNGTNGANGANGLTNLVSVSDEPAGTNCKHGGKKIETGLDDDADGVLDASEIDQTSYVCNVMPCFGKSYENACWHLGAAGQSCTTVCSTFGGYDEATRTLAGDLGTIDRCEEVLALFGFTGIVSLGDDAGFGNTGCSYVPSLNVGVWVRNPQTTAGGTNSELARACACNY